MDAPPPVTLPAEIRQINTGFPSALPQGSFQGAGAIAAPVQTQNNTGAFSITVLLTYGWLIGAIFVLGRHLYLHYRFIKMVRRWSEDITHLFSSELQLSKTEMGISGRVCIRKCDFITTPMMVGFKDAVILLPGSLFPETLNSSSALPAPIADFFPEHDELLLILKHELVHYQRKDTWYKVLLLIASAIHWFNPVMYIIKKAVALQCEISCDAEVTRDADTGSRILYGEAILGSIRNQTGAKTALSTHFLKNKKDMKQRILAIMDKTKKKTGSAIICLILIISAATGISFAGTPVKPQDDGGIVYYAVSDGIKLTITNIRREKNLLMMHWTLEDTTGDRLNLTEEEQFNVGVLLKQENNRAADAIKVGSFGFDTNNSYDTENRAISGRATAFIDTSGTTVAGSGTNEVIDYDTRRIYYIVADTGTFSFEEIIVGNIIRAPSFPEGGTFTPGTIYFPDRSLSFRGNWTMQIQIPESGWYLSKGFAIDPIEPHLTLRGLEISDATLWIRPEGNIFIDGSTKITGQFRISRQDDIELIFADGTKEVLTVSDYEIKPIDFEMVEFIRQNYMYTNLPKEGDTHTARLHLERGAEKEPFTLDIVETIEALSINGVVLPIKAVY